MRKRIKMLNRSASRKKSVWKLSCVLPLLCLFMWSASIKEEVHFINEESSMGKIVETMAILPSTLDQELDLIEAYFGGDHATARVRITNRKRDKDGLLTAFKFKTKFKGQARFYTRFSINGESGITYKGHQILYSDGIINVSEIGPNATHFKITEEKLEFIGADIKMPVSID